MRSLAEVIDDLPQSPWTFWTVIALLVVGGALFLDWLDLEPPTELHDCTRSHTVFIPITHTMSCGKGCVSSYVSLVPITTCDAYGPWYPNPRHAEWVIRQRNKELQKK